ncbi:MAG: DUF6316 family protein [Pseudomonadales bacterium]
MRFRKEDKQASKQSERAPVRSERFFKKDSGWYFKTREGIAVGPYADAFDAELSASLLISRLAQLESEEDPRIAIRRFQDDPAVGPLARKMESMSRSDVTSLLKSYRDQQRMPTLRRAWRAVSKHLPVAGSIGGIKESDSLR